MTAREAGATSGQVARKFEISHMLLEKWRSVMAERGEAAFPGAGRRSRIEIQFQRRAAGDRRVERKIGRWPMETTF